LPAEFEVVDGFLRFFVHDLELGIFMSGYGLTP